MSSASTKIIQAAAGNAGEALYVEDVFSTYLYEGNGSTKTITNGIDLAGEGGLVWIKTRNTTRHGYLWDTERGVFKAISSSLTNAEAEYQDSLTDFNSDGFGFNETSSTNVRVNNNGDDYVSWTFRKAPKFFDVVTFTADAGSNNGTKAHAHNLGSSPGFIIIKQTNAANSWVTFHRSLAANNLMFLNATSDVSINSGYYSSVSDTHVTVGNALNENSAEYVMYLFAHNNSDGEYGDNSDQDIIKCGSYTGNGNLNGPDIDLGFEPQLVIQKSATVSGSWIMLDAMRGFTSGVTNGDKYLQANFSTSEQQDNFLKLTSNGFKVESTNTALNSSGQTYIYIAIRRGPMKTPESATEVFDVDAYSGNSGTQQISIGFPADSFWQSSLLRVADTSYFSVCDRLRGYTNYLATNQTWNEPTFSYPTNYMTGFDNQTKMPLGSAAAWNWNGGGNSARAQHINYAFRRAPGFFDVVTYDGTSSARVQNHNLGVVPEMIIVKARNNFFSWTVFHKDAPTSGSVFQEINLNNTNIWSAGNSAFPATTPTSTGFYLPSGTASASNRSGWNYVAYLFATLDGISKVGSYTGNGSTQTINCGFSTGARFVLIKAATYADNWYVFDTGRGIVAGNDPYLAFDTTDAQINAYDLLDPDSSGFIINSNNRVNRSGTTFIFLAIA